MPKPARNIQQDVSPRKVLPTTHLNGEKTARIDTAELHHALGRNDLSNGQVAWCIRSKVEDLEKDSRQVAAQATIWTKLLTSPRIAT